MNTFFLLDAPYSGGDLFLYHYENQSSRAIKRYRDNLQATSSEELIAVTTVSPKVLADFSATIPLDKIGIMLCDPALRLAKAYADLQRLGRAKESFKEYYSNRRRVNLFNQSLAGKTLESLGFVGVSERFNSSLHLASDWFDVNQRLGHHSGSNIMETSVNTLLSEEHRADIKRIHAEDYKLFDLALRLVSERISASYPAQTSNLKAPKEIIIHVGPPKTGTSAIRAWLLQNNKVLESKGIYYPTHQPVLGLW